MYFYYIVSSLMMMANISNASELHSHAERVHSHPLPENGINHRHNGSDIGMELRENSSSTVDNNTTRGNQSPIIRDVNGDIYIQYLGEKNKKADSNDEHESEYMKNLEKAVKVYKKDPKKAIELIEKSISIDDSSPNAFFIKGAVFSYLGEKTKDSDFIKEAIYNYSYVIGYLSNKKTNNNLLATTFMMRGSVFHDVSLYEDALDDYDKACLLSEEHCSLYYQSKELYSHLGII